MCYFTALTTNMGSAEFIFATAEAVLAQARAAAGFAMIASMEGRCGGSNGMGLCLTMSVGVRVIWRLRGLYARAMCGGVGWGC